MPRPAPAAPPHRDTAAAFESFEPADPRWLGAFALLILDRPTARVSYIDGHGHQFRPEEAFD